MYIFFSKKVSLSPETGRDILRYTAVVAIEPLVGGGRLEAAEAADVRPRLHIVEMGEDVGKIGIA